MRVSVVAAMALILTSCSGLDRRDFRGLKTEAADGRFGEAVFVTSGGCPQADKVPFTDEEFAAAGAVLLPVVASTGASFLTSYIEKSLEKAKEGLSGQFVASAVVNAGEPRTDGCLIIVRGIFDDVFSGDPGDFRQETLEALSLADYPAFYLELKTRRDTENIALQPAYLAYSTSISRRSGSGRKNVAAVVVASSEALTNDEGVRGDAPFAVFRHDLGRLQIGRSYNAAQLMPGTAASQPLDEGFSTGAYNISVLVTDSEGPSIALQALTAAYSDNAGDLENALENIFRNALGAGEEGK